jgi:uncharacterized protein
MPRRTRGFAPIPRLKLPFRSVVVASTNDPFIEIERARDLAKGWDAEFIDIGLCGHINVASGFGPWPAGERIIASMMDWIHASGWRPSNALNAAALA